MAAGAFKNYSIFGIDLYLLRKPEDMKRFFILLLIACATASPAQPGRYSVSAHALYAMPAGGLSDRVKPALNFDLAAGQRISDKWVLSGGIEWSRFDDSNHRLATGETLALELDHIGVLATGRYTIAELGPLHPVAVFSAGIYHWRSVRGEIEKNDALGIPAIDKKERSETNMGFRSGLGSQLYLSHHISVDLLAHYRFIVGDLWPALQPDVDLEGASGLQSFTLSIGMNFTL